MLAAIPAYDETADKMNKVGLFLEVVKPILGKYPRVVELVRQQVVEGKQREDRSSMKHDW